MTADMSNQSSEKPEDTSPAPRSDAPKIIPRQKAVSDAVVSAIQKTDETVLRLNRLLSTKAGQDIVLSNLNHTSHALHYLLASSPISRLRLTIRLWLLRRLGRNVSSIPPPPATKIASAQQPPLLAFSNLISKTRYTLRLLGLVSMWSWGSATYKSPPKDPVLRAVAYLEVLSMLVYQALENATYLASNGVIGDSLIKRTGGIGKWELWSIRSWFGYVLLEFVRLWRESILFAQREREEQRQVSAGEKSIAVADAELKAAREAEIRSWRKSLVNNLAWAPLCAHWSFEKGIGVPSSLTGFVSLLAGVWGTYDAWQATALL
ncbi:conserved hypothetical protein [Talaromyces stipitatus ATCC 10500]|uniref:Peroxin 11C n=1 Tax=Talaromyces stipitatus (strain ATCC 10500 / CBS 375.48 / QM 6759 / NRRL 1006) TaxID=441959 RepID=B8LYA9_TALSN|nr:uncharacterized protein TSTA_063200 [Talaromyces stipitatus ATCC 10500]EED22838.1 conserved hypothetical protein [Talaromyces stipitatus ATCC 10500]